MSKKGNVNSHIAQVAGRQWGHVTRRQLLTIGIEPRTITVWVAAGRLVRVHAGVYAVGYRRLEPVARAAAAVLAAGPGAVLSHDSAAALWELRRWPREPEVTAARGVRRPGITAHRSTTLRDADVTTQLGIRTTTPARTLRDIRPRLAAKRFPRLVNDARLKHILADDDAEAFLHHRRNPTRSGLEDDFQRFLERHHLPQPLINVTLPQTGHEVDAFYPEQRVIVEIDDYGTHGDPVTFASDRERDAAHAALRCRTVRLIRERLTAHEADRLRRTLASSS